MSDARDILMPALPDSADGGRLAKWLVAEGDRVSAGDIIAEVGNSRTTMEVEVDDDGVVEKILIAAGTEGITADTPIARLIVDRAAADAGSVMSEVATPFGGNDAVVQSSIPNAVTSPSLPRGAAGIAAQTITQTMREALRDAIIEEMRRDPDVLVLDEEVGQNVGSYTVCEGLLDEFGPRRVIETTAAAGSLAGIGIGLAFSGLKPVVAFKSWSLAMQAIEQIVQSAAKTHYMSGGEMRVPVVFRAVNGASAQAGAQHSQCLSAWFAHVPGLKVVMPSNAADAKGLLKSAIRDPGPVVVLEHEALYWQSGEVPAGEDDVVEIGKARVARAGRDATIVSYGRGVATALAAAEQLARECISAEVIDLRSLRPLDIAAVIASVSRTHRLVTVEDSWPVSSVGSEICARVATDAFHELRAPPVKICGADVPMPYAANLELLALPSAETMASAVRRVCQQGS